MSIETDAEIVATCETALTYLTEQGWTQDVYLDESEETAACLAGAVIIAKAGKQSVIDEDMEFDAALHCPAIKAIAETIAETHPARVPGVARHAARTIYVFNDHIATTRADVIDVVQKTIKRHSDERVETP